MIDLIQSPSDQLNVSLGKADRLKRLTLHMSGEDVHLDEDDKRMILTLTRVNELLSSGEIRKSKIAKCIAEEYSYTLSNAYLLIKKTEELFGHVEYDGLRPDQVFAVRIYEWLYTDLKEKYDKSGKTWYMNEMLKIVKRIDVIKGVTKEKQQKIDYGLWRRRTLKVSSDPKHLKIGDDDDA